MLLIKQIQNTETKPQTLLCLLDLGATSCWINSTVIPENIQSITMSETTNQTLAGTFSSNKELTLYNAILPEFHRSRHINKITTKIFHHQCRYDMIIGRDLLNELGIVLNFNEKTISWEKAQITMRTYPSIKTTKTIAETWFLDAAEETIVRMNDDGIYTPSNKSTRTDDIFFQENNATTEGYKSKQIHESLYDKVNITEVVNKCTYLSKQQQQELHQLLSSHPTLFDRKLKLFVGPKVHLQLVDNPVPSRHKPYSVPKSQLHVFKQELERLISIGVLEKAKRLEWIAGTFIVPKKDGRVRWITDFHGLNKSLRRRVYPQ